MSSGEAAPLLQSKAASAGRGDFKVIGAGLGRTGTDSLRKALTDLGYKTYHMFEMSAAHQAYWLDWIDGKPNAFEAVVDNVFAAGGFTATTDFPGCLMVEELAARFPDAKIVLSVRSSPEAWAKSINKTIGRFGPLALRPPMKYVIGKDKHRLQEFFWARIGAKRQSDGKLIGLEEAYTKWIEHVKATIPADRLLVHNAADGWEPLCEFLGVDAVPDSPYPHSNTGKSMETSLGWLQWATDTWPLAGVLFGGGVTLVVAIIVVGTVLV